MVGCQYKVCQLQNQVLESRVENGVIIYKPSLKCIHPALQLKGGVELEGIDIYRGEYNLLNCLARLAVGPPEAREISSANPLTIWNSFTESFKKCGCYYVRSNWSSKGTSCRVTNQMKEYMLNKLLSKLSMILIPFKKLARDGNRLPSISSETSQTDVQILYLMEVAQGCHHRLCDWSCFTIPALSA